MRPIKPIIKQHQSALVKRFEPDIGGRHPLGRKGFPSRLFLVFLSFNRIIFHNFLNVTSLVVQGPKCPRCDRTLTLGSDSKVSDRFRWRCGKTSAGVTCNGSVSFRVNSWFTHSKLRISDILLLTYDILKGVTADNLIGEYAFSSRTVADWRQFIMEVLVDYIEIHSEKLGGPGKIVEIDESKFGKRKYNRGHPVDGQWVFGGVERGSGKLFLVAVHDRSADTLLGVIKDWIHPNTTIYSDCWKAYNCLENEGFTHLTVNHSIQFVDEDTGCHTNTIESEWRHLKSDLPDYNRKSKFEFYLAEYLFKKSCAVRGVCSFTTFLEIVREQNWDGWVGVSDTEDSD